MAKKKKYYKKRKRTRSGAGFYVTVVLLLAIVITAITIIIKNNRENAMIASTGTRIYFYDTQSNSLKPEYRQIPEAQNTEKVKFVLEELSVGPKNTLLSASVPHNMIKSASISGSNVDVSVTGDYSTLKNSEEIICRAAIVNSLSELSFVDTVSINIDGSELLKPNGQPFGKIKAADVVLAPDISPKGESIKTIVLYFADANNTGLSPESRAISSNPNESVEKYIIQELIKGPASESLLPTIPPETKLLEITVRDGVCSVDLSRDFIARHTGAPGTEKLSIYSIVNSLCELSDINSVQFLIESKRQEQFKDETGFNNLYEAKEISLAVTE